MIDQQNETPTEVEPGIGAPAETSVTAAEETIQTLTSEIATLNDRLMRALADAENVRRQKDREVDEARKYAITGFARGLLDVADNLRRALASVPRQQESKDPLLDTLLLGVDMTERSLHALFDKHRIRKVEPGIGERFDPNLHQAMFEVPTTQVPAGSVAEVLQPGYVLADRLLRPALVGVAKPAANATGQPETASGTIVDTKA